MRSRRSCSSPWSSGGSARPRASRAAPASRSHIRFAMLGLAWMWVYDLNLYTVAYLRSSSAIGLAEWRGMAVALTAPLFALGARHREGLKIRLSRAATFQSLSLL